MNDISYENIGKDNPVIVRTYVHLEDRKGWKQVYDYAGEFCCGNFYRERKRLTYRDVGVCLEKTSYPRMMDDLRNIDYEFELKTETHECIYDKYYFKHLYFEEL